MGTITFFEKPGCVNNTKQKQLLSEAGYTVIARDLLHEQWTRQRLEAFFSGMPVVEWFNRSAPRVRDGEVVPEQLEADEAYRLMIAEPLLIRRPLMIYGEKNFVGFDMEKLTALLPGERGDVDLESCPRSHGSSCDSNG